MSDFGKAIQTLRKRKNLTQAELASSLNVSGQAVSKWENNLSQPDLDTMQKLMKIFEVSWEEFSALCGYGENEAEEEKKLSERRSQETIAAVAVSATTAANNASEAAKMTARAAEELTTQPKLSGVCAYCGKAMYGEKNVYLKSPKIVCNECAERVTGKITSIKESNRREFKKAMILPAVIVAIVTVVFTAFSFIGGAGAISLAWLPLGFLVWLPIPQICWDRGPVPDIFDGTCGKTIRMPGIIFELSIDGVIWAILVKIGLWILSAALGLLLSLAGYIICMIVAPFSFLPVMKKEKQDAEDSGNISVSKVLSILDGEKHSV